MHPDVATAAYFANQHGMVSSRQCATAGLSARQIRSRVEIGLWVPRYAGVYEHVAVPRTRAGEIMAAVLAASVDGDEEQYTALDDAGGIEAVAGWRTAAELHGLHRLAPADPAAAPIELAVWDTTPKQLPGICVHRTRELEAVDRTTVDGVPATTVERTFVDLSGVDPPEVQLAGLDEAMAARLTTRRRVHRTAVRLRAGRPGTRLLIAVTADGAEEAFRSWLERRGSLVFAAGHLPAPRWNVKVHDEQGLIGLVDALFDPVCQPVELDGLRFHAPPDAYGKDRARDNRMGLRLGRPVLRYTYRDLIDRPGAVVAELRRALGLPPLAVEPVFPPADLTYLHHLARVR